MPDFDICSGLCCLVVPILLFGVLIGVFSGLSKSPSQWTGRGSSGPGPMYYMRDDD